MIPRWSSLLLVVLFVVPVRSQLSIDDIISRALSLVRPLFDTSAPLQNDAVVKKQMVPSPSDRRDTSILGSRQQSPLDDLPLCRGNSRICQFMTCSAENFKKDSAFSNLQLGAQILGDTKLRQAISSNPEAIDAVCREQGMDESQCKLFSKGFQLIDRFITTIEEPKKEKHPDPEPVPIPIQRDNQVLMDDDYPQVPVASDAKPVVAHGSQTWSSRIIPQNDAPQMYEVRNDLVASLTPPPYNPLTNLFPPITLTPFHPPSPPTAPPLAFPTVPSFILPTFKLPQMDKGLFFPADKQLFGPPGKAESIIRRKREVEADFDEEEESQRVKRDYYDELTTGSQAKTTNKPKAGESEDYYGSLDEGEEPTSKPNPLRDCVLLLGLRG